MSTAHVPVLLDGARTAYGKLGGSLTGKSGAELSATVIRALLDKQPAYAEPDGVLLGQVLQGGQGQNPARQAATAGGVDPTVPATTLNNVCLTGLSAVADASRRVRLGEGSLYLVGGGDSMTQAPHAAQLRTGHRVGPVEFVDTMIRDGLWCSLTDEGMGELSERVNADLGVKREDQDALAARSHQLAARAQTSGRLAEEIVPTTVGGQTVSVDEGVRPDTTAEGLAELRPAFAEYGSITAGNASQMSDGASVGVVSSLATAERLGQQPLAYLRGYVEVAGPDNSLHLKPAAAIRLLIDRSDLRLEDIELFEINEAFAGVVVASCDNLGLPTEKVNVNGGAIALGHPLGGTGFRLLLTLARELEHRGARYGIASLCGGGGQGAAALIERRAS